MEKARIGIIGGSGLYEIEGFQHAEEVAVETPFGKPSDKYIIGTLSGKKIAFLSRHGRGHRVDPSSINYRANIWGMKQLGVQKIISVSAVGSMKENIAPGMLVIPDQFIDRTTKRISSFFVNEGIVAHIPFADPLCKSIITYLYTASTKVTKDVQKNGTYLNMEGPQFSTRAESNLYRSWGVDVIGMTNLTEAKLAREAEICYGTLALATDYDSWRTSEEGVSVEEIVEVLKQNIKKAKTVIKHVIPLIDEDAHCSCQESLKYAIMTHPDCIDAQLRDKYTLLIAKYTV